MASSTRLTNHAELYSILFSHFNEAARWALDVAKIPYVEHGYLPLLHMIPVAWASRGGKDTTDRSSSRFSTPLLILDGDVLLHDSQKIIEHADKVMKEQGEEGLIPTSPNSLSKYIEIMTMCHDHIGVDARRIAYFYTLQDTRLIRWMIDRNFQGVQHFIGSWTAPIIRYLIFKSLNINQDRAMRSLDRMRKNFDYVAEQLAGKSPNESFIVGTKFTAADIFFASLAAPVLGISKAEGYGAHLPPMSELQTDGAVVIQELRDHPAGQHALKVFKHFRGQRQIPYVFPEL